MKYPPTGKKRTWNLPFLLVLLPPLAVSSSVPGSAETFHGEQARAIHVLNRLTFGPRPGDIERVMRSGLERFIEQQLHPETLSDPDLNARLLPFETLEMSTAELFNSAASLSLLRRQAPNQAATIEKDIVQAVRRNNRKVAGELAQARLLRAVYSERQLQELMVDFWMNHFNVFIRDGNNLLLMPEYENHVIRPRVLGRFEDLLVAVARSPAMLLYLDNWVSSAPKEVVRRQAGALESRGYRVRSGSIPALGRARGLNENYARELLELHTLGVDGGYTQEDIIQVANCFTGWTIARDGQGPAFVFEPILHLNGNKSVMRTTIRSAGEQEGLQILHFLATHPATARTISRKLVRRFVADDPPVEMVEAASRTFQRTGGDIREVLRTIFHSPRFLSREYHQVKIRKPFELVAGALRATGAEFQESKFLLDMMAEMGEALYLCEQPDGYPDTADAWLSTHSILKRINFAIALATGQVPKVRVDLDSAALLFEQVGLPVPAEAQQGPPLDWVKKRKRVPAGAVEAAFRLSSPLFQKK